MKLWQEFVQAQESSLGKEAVSKWLQPLKIAHFDARNLYLETDDPFAIHWFEEHIRSKACKSFVNNNNAPIKIHLALTQALSTPKKQKKSWKPNLNLSPDSLDPQATFDLFVPGECNELTVRLFKNILDKKEVFNPVFLTGPLGCGKTHLLMAAASYLTNKGFSCFYVRAETFTDHLIGAIRNGANHTFRTLYRNHDYLLVDDIDSIAGRQATQEEFFHMFNALHTAGKQMIFAARQLPRSSLHIEPRLTSRFEWGIVLSITSLKSCEYKELLLKRLEHLSFPLPDETISYLLEHFDSASSLIAAVNALMLSAHLNHELSQKLIPDKAAVILEKLLLEEQSVKLTPEKIISCVCDVCHTAPSDILGKSQKQECVLPRQIAIYLCRLHLNMPFKKIGAVFSRDHSTIMTSVKLMEEKLNQKNQEISQLIQEISYKLKR